MAQQNSSRPMRYVRNKNELPIDSDFTCPICLNNIDPDEILDGKPNCVICSNGHRMHNSCFSRTQIHECPVCRTPNLSFCYSAALGYAYVDRTNPTTDSNNQPSNEEIQRTLRSDDEHLRRARYMQMMQPPQFTPMMGMPLMTPYVAPTTAASQSTIQAAGNKKRLRKSRKYGKTRKSRKYGKPRLSKKTRK